MGHVNVPRSVCWKASGSLLESNKTVLLYPHVKGSLIIKPGVFLLSMCFTFVLQLFSGRQLSMNLIAFIPEVA